MKAHRLVRATAVTLAILLGPVPARSQSMMRPDVMGREAAVVSDHVLASNAGAAVLRRGGNAVDAAITMAAVLAVVRPHMNGVGGDNFLLIREAKTGRVYALNGSGRAGAKATPAFFAERKLTQVPSTGILSVSVPGAVRAWEDALKRFGTISLSDALQPAIDYAERGFPVSTRLSLDIREELREGVGRHLAQPDLPHEWKGAGAWHPSGPGRPGSHAANDRDRRSGRGVSRCDCAANRGVHGTRGRARHRG